MAHKAGRYYVAGIAVLCLCWAGWQFVPIGPGLHEQEGYRLLGYLIIDAVFCAFGVFGLVLAYRRRLNYDLAALAASMPLGHFIGEIAPRPFSWMVLGLWAVMLCLFSVVVWRS